MAKMKNNPEALLDGLIGLKFNRLKILSIKRENSYLMAFCVCDCGTPTKVYLTSVKQGGTKSCGCLAKENRVVKKNINNRFFARRKF